ncbi:Craniofacial development protein 2 [Stylophora pistillata]|uniref:Craniofacial development protein 2 n=1 Tax=Stylophora pistillata TaxID=50429 RepID=A0A2B4RYR8_STYPI|nr:Craniofacial development protein 2 [Stylophora pistillata]
MISNIPNKEQLILLGDFNARVGADQGSWPSCLGKFGIGNMNDNGKRLLELCTYHNLCIANSFFNTKPQHKEGLLETPALKTLASAGSHPGAKRAALMEYKRSPCEKNLQILRAARNKVKHTARRCANDYWTELSETIQTAEITGNIIGMYEGIKTAMRPTKNKTAPLKSTTGEVITDKRQQMERWVEDYSELYSQHNVVTTSALHAIKCLPVMGELDSEPPIDELSKAINSLASRKAPGSDGIPPDLIKHCKTTLLQPVHEVLCEPWREGAVPQYMRDAKIVTLYKNKGQRNDCIN